MGFDLNIALGLEDPTDEYFENATCQENECFYKADVVYKDNTSDGVDDPDACIIIEDLGSQPLVGNVFDSAPIIDDEDIDIVDHDSSFIDKCEPVKIEKEESSGADHRVFDTSPITIEDLGTQSLADNVFDSALIIDNEDTNNVENGLLFVDKCESVKIEKEESSGELLHNELLKRHVLKKEEVCDDATTSKAEVEASSKDVVRLTCQKLEEKLSVGKVFPDLEKVYLLYCEYARFKGFSVRKGEQRYFGKSDCVRWKLFHCSCTGLPAHTSVKRRLSVYKKLVIRTDCKAKLIVTREDMGCFVVSIFEYEHNHGLVRSDQTYLLRSCRNLSYAKKSVLDALNSVGIGVSTACKFMEKESGGVENVGFIRKDVYHHVELQKKVTQVEDADAWMLLDYFTNKSNTEPYFWWKYQLDDSGRIMNIFWRDTRCVIDYDAFGDVLSVDTTFRTNRYNLIAAPFVGINHHTNNVLFGMALLSDETTTSFKWLFETFLASMHGKQPKIIFSDQCRPMMNAIDETFTNSKHRLCQWHVSRNCNTNFKKLNGDASFKKLWHKCMNSVRTVKEFDDTWNEMMSYEIENPSWFNGMHKLRERWSSVFTRGIFSAGLLATSRSESTNSALKNILRTDIPIFEFVRKYEDFQNGWRLKESNEDTWAIWNPGLILEDNELLSHAVNVYTRTVFKSFEYAFTRSMNYVLGEIPRILDDGKIEFTARKKGLGPVCERIIILNPETNVATCSCAYWETEGLICSHIIKVYDRSDISLIPEALILRRWTKSAKKDFARYNATSTLGQGHESSLLNYMTFTSVTMRHMYEMVSSGFKHEAARPKIVELMKGLNDAFSDIMSSFPTSATSGNDKKEYTDGTKFRDPKKVPDRGFAAANAAKKLMKGGNFLSR